MSNMPSNLGLYIALAIFALVFHLATRWVDRNSFRAERKRQKALRDRLAAAAERDRCMSKGWRY